MTIDVSGEIYSMHYKAFKHAICTSPESIFHYTSSTALVSILQTKKMWFTNIKFLNDETENRLIFHLLDNYIEENREDYNEDYYRAIKILCEQLLDEREVFDYVLFEVKNTYVASFSTQPDQLNLWNYYTKNPHSVGYNIEFNPKEFVEFSCNGNSLSYCGKVIYSEEDQRKLLIPLIKDFYTKYKTISEEPYKNMLIQELATILCEFSIFFKVKDFEQEEEYRMVWKTPKRANVRECRNFFISYVEYALPITSIKSIGISPTQKDKLVELGLKELLSNYVYEEDFNHIDIKPSKIPVRY